MTNQQGAPEALRLADLLILSGALPGSVSECAGIELRRLHAENERLAALVEAQQPAPSAAAAGEVPLPLLVRDIAADLGTTPIQVCTALAQLGFGGHSVNMAVTPRMAKSLRAHFASPTPQADSQPVPTNTRQIAECYGDCPKDPKTCANPCKFEGRAARAPADSVTAPAGPIKPLPYEPTSAMLIAARERDPALPIETVRAIYWSMWRTAPTQAADSLLEDAARLEQIAEAIRDYHYALDMRKHGGLAESAAFSSICNTMGMHWNRGEEAARRAAREQGGA